MSISSVRFIIAAILIMTGILIMVIQTFGVFRLKYALNRMHACGNGRLSRNYDGYSGNDGYLWFFLCIPEAFDSANCFLVCVAGVQSSARKT